MSQISYTGDIQLNINNNGEWDMTYENGQPYMTDAFSTCITLAIFGEPDFWQNSLTNNDSEKYISKFPSVISNARVNNDTINAGTDALKNALKFLTVEKIAESVTVSGAMISVYEIDWTINITRDGTSTKYRVNWNKGIARGFEEGTI